MKKFFNLWVMVLMMLPLLSCQTKNKAQEEKQDCCVTTAAENTQTSSCCSQKTEAKNVKVYYFHFTRRCATCKAVEEVAQQALKENFASQIQEGQISFVSINLDEDKTLAEELEVSGQTLMVVKGCEKTNLTNQAFMNARSNPDKLKALLKDTIKPLI